MIIMILLTEEDQATVDECKKRFPELLSSLDAYGEALSHIKNRLAPSCVGRKMKDSAGVTGLVHYPSATAVQNYSANFSNPNPDSAMTGA